MDVSGAVAPAQDGRLFTGGPFRIFEIEFGLRVDDEDLGRFLGSVLAPFRSRGRPTSWYEVLRSPSVRGHRVLLDGEQVLEMADRHLVGVFLWHLNLRAMLETRTHLMVHAGAVSLDGCAVVLPGDPDAGKSTLVAALVQAGFSYLSDEAAAVDLQTGRVCAYPRAIALGPGSWPLLPTLEPSEESRRRTDDLWLLNPDEIRRGSMSAPCVSRAVIFPVLRSGTAAHLAPVSRAESVRRLARRSTNLVELGEPGFRALASLVAGATCWNLYLDGVDAAVESVRYALTYRERSVPD